MAGKFVPADSAALETITILPGLADEIAAGQIEAGNLVQWGDAVLVAFAGPESQWGIAPSEIDHVRPCWKITGAGAGENGPEQRTFWIDASTGEVLDSRDEILRFDNIVGAVQAMATPGLAPDSPPVVMPTPDIKVTIQGTSLFDYTDANGVFEIPYTGGYPVTVATSVHDGRWVNVDADPASSSLSASFELQAPNLNPLLTLNANPTSIGTGQANMLLHITKVHNMIKSWTSWTGLDTPILAHIDDSPQCQGDGGATGWGISFEAGAAVSTVIAHEYGHLMVNQLGLGQGSFGEGFGDSVVVATYDTPCMFPACVTGACNRDYAGTDGGKDYPCSTMPECGPSDFHCCGRVLAGLWWDIREKLVAKFGLVQGKQRTQRLFVKWAMMTNGGIGREGAHPFTVHEIITADGNGSPGHSIHRQEICEAAALHGLATGSGSNCAVLPPPGTGTLLSFRTPYAVYASRAGDPCNAGCANPYGIAVADVDADSKSDVVLACELNHKLLLFFGQTSTPTNYAVDCSRTITVALPAALRRPAKIALGDFSLTNGTPDSRKDIVIAFQGDGTTGSAGVLLLLNKGQAPWFDGTDSAVSRLFDATSGLNMPSPIGVFAADFDENGQTDIAVAGSSSGNVAAFGVVWFDLPGGQVQTTPQVIPFAGTTGFATAVTGWKPPGDTFRLALSHIEQGGTAHLFLLRVDPSPRSIDWINPEPGNPPDPISSPSIDSGDIDLDGDFDLAVPCAVGGTEVATMCWHRQNGLNSDNFEEERGFFANPPAVGIAVGRLSKTDTIPPVADLLPEVVTTSQTPLAPPEITFDPRISVFANRGGTEPTDQFVEHGRFAITPVPTDRPRTREVVLFDINQDGLLDIITSNQGVLNSSDMWEGFSVLLNRK